MARVSVLSVQYVKTPVTAKEFGVVIDPTSYTLTMCLTAPGESPEDPQPNFDADWERDDSRPESPRYLARLLVGPGTDLGVQDPGTYDVWCKITGPDPEIPVFKADDQVEFF